ncbi:MAG: hypothetical protein H7296_00325 [Bacteroidia bacterium]|nr:hypothetical protein [Bacteroidia bacterium]
MAILPGFTFKHTTLFFHSVRKSFFLAELLCIFTVTLQARGSSSVISMALIISSWHFIIYYLTKKSNTNLYLFGLPVTFIAVLYFNSITGPEINFTAYTLLLFFYTFLFIEVPYKYIFIGTFITGACISEYYKGVELHTIYLFLIPSLGSAVLFLYIIHLLQLDQKKLIAQNTELYEAKSSLDALIENTKSSIWCIDKNYCYLKGNLKFKKSLLNNFKNNVNYGDNLLDLAFSDYEREFWKNVYDRGLNGESFIKEATSVENKETTFREHSVNPMTNSDGIVYGVNIVSKDITKKKGLEKSRKENEQLLNLMIDKMPIGFELFNENGLLIMMNEVQKHNLGLSSVDESLGKFNVLADPFTEYSGQLTHFLQAYKTGEIVTFESEVDYDIPQNNRTKKKGKSYYEVVLFSVQNEKAGIIALTRDITGRKLNEKKLNDQNKQMETYTFTLSHVIRRPIANLISLTNLLDNDGNLNEDEQLTIQHIHESVKQLDDIIKNLNYSITSINPKPYEH